MGNAIKMCKGVVLLLLVPFFVSGQLREFEVSEMEPPDVAVVQANNQFPDDALLLVYSSLDGLQFRSSMGAVNKQTYNTTAGRYEVLVKPVKQMIFVSKLGYMEFKLATINPNPKDVFYFKTEEKRQKISSNKRGVLRIATVPRDCRIELNDMKLADQTPAEISVAEGENKLSLKKYGYGEIDTFITISSADTINLSVTLKELKNSKPRKIDYSDPLNWKEVSKDRFSIRVPVDWAVEESADPSVKMLIVAPLDDADDKYRESVFIIGGKGRWPTARYGLDGYIKNESRGKSKVLTKDYEGDHHGNRPYFITRSENFGVKTYTKAMLFNELPDHFLLCIGYENPEKKQELSSVFDRIVDSIRFDR